MKTATLTAALLALILTAPVRAQEASREDFREFCQMQLGRWIGDVTWVADWPGFGKKGDKVVAYLEGNLVEEGNAMTFRFFGGQGSGTVLAYYDAQAKRIRLISVLSTGGSNQGIVYKKNGQWFGEGTGCLADGTPTQYSHQITITDNGNVMTFTGMGKVGDEKTDDQHDVWRRVSEPAK
jgi:hypothetical protein